MSGKIQSDDEAKESKNFLDKYNNKKVREPEGEDLDQNIRKDYESISRLDQYNLSELDSKEYSNLSIRQRL